ncbi:BRCT domain-containing protein, partial [Cephalotus follicularis]
PKIKFNCKRENGTPPLFFLLQFQILFVFFRLTTPTNFQCCKISMSDSKTSQKRNLPPWMSSKDQNNASSSTSNSFSKLMEGVVFVLSGFVNPERSTLRSQALELGAEYQQDWNSGCTLLVCAFPNTPKFRQVEADCGTIVSKDWITECYTKKKLVDIESYLMNAGKPWRRSNALHESSHGHGKQIMCINKKTSPPRKSQKQVERRSHSKLTASIPSKSGAYVPIDDLFSPSKVKEMAIADLDKTISWLESQEEKPEPSEIKQIAAQGILTCLQDAIDSLEGNQDVRKIMEGWNFVPRVVEELGKLEDAVIDSASLSNEDICKQAKVCKHIYEEQLKPSKKGDNGRTKDKSSNDSEGYDSDETIEMTEEEIDLAFKNVSSTK